MVSGYLILKKKMDHPTGEVTRLLQEWSDGQEQALKVVTSRQPSPMACEMTAAA